MNASTLSALLSAFAALIGYPPTMTSHLRRRLGG